MYKLIRLITIRWIKVHFYSLDSCVLEMGVEGSTGADLNILEKCECPEGYKGLSCESCDYGYARITHEGTMLRHHPICTKCNCNGHAQTCDAITGQCSVCIKPSYMS